MQSVALWWKSRLHPVARPMLRMSPAATACSSVVERQATQGIRALVGAVGQRVVLVCSALLYFITRQHCGGVCREKLGGPRVAFFLSGLSAAQVLPINISAKRLAGDGTPRFTLKANSKARGGSPVAIGNLLKLANRGLATPCQYLELGLIKPFYVLMQAHAHLQLRRD